MSQCTLVFNADATQSTFNFGGHVVRIIVRDGEPWFVAKDLCDALEIKNSRDSLSALDADEKGVGLTDTIRGQQKIAIVNESGMHTLVLRCRDAIKPGTVPYRFRKWVTGEVLPAIRKTGGYARPTADALRLKQAYELAAQVAAVAARTVFDALIDDRAASLTDRWMFCMGHPNRDGIAAPWAKPIQGDAMVVSLKDLPNRILAPNGMMPTNQELADLAAACNQRLAKRMEFEARKQVAA